MNAYTSYACGTSGIRLLFCTVTVISYYTIIGATSVIDSAPLGLVLNNSTLVLYCGKRPTNSTRSIPAMQITYEITIAIMTMVHSENLYVLSSFCTMQWLFLSTERVYNC